MEKNEGGYLLPENKWKKSYINKKDSHKNLPFADNYVSQ